MAASLQFRRACAVWLRARCSRKPGCMAECRSLPIIVAAGPRQPGWRGAAQAVPRRSAGTHGASPTPSRLVPRPSRRSQPRCWSPSIRTTALSTTRAVAGLPLRRRLLAPVTGAADAPGLGPQLALESLWGRIGLPDAGSAMPRPRRRPDVRRSRALIDRDGRRGGAAARGGDPGRRGCHRHGQARRQPTKRCRGDARPRPRSGPCRPRRPVPVRAAAWTLHRRAQAADGISDFTDDSPGWPSGPGSTCTCSKVPSRAT